MNKTKTRFLGGEYFFRGKYFSGVNIENFGDHLKITQVGTLFFFYIVFRRIYLVVVESVQQGKKEGKWLLQRNKEDGN